MEPESLREEPPIQGATHHVENDGDDWSRGGSKLFRTDRPEDTAIFSITTAIRANFQYYDRIVCLMKLQNSNKTVKTTIA